MNETENTVCPIIGETPNVNESVVCNVTTTEKLVGIYGLRNKINGKWYVGQSIDIIDRWKDYRKLKCKCQRKLYNALKKYGYGGFEKVVIERCDPIEWILDYREMYWIRHLNSVETGYNLTHGGSRGRLSSETKKLLSEKAKARGPRPDWVRQRISSGKRGIKWSAQQRMKYVPILKTRQSALTDAARKVNTGSHRTTTFKFTDAQKQLMSERRRGKRVSEETKQKMRDSALKRVRKPFSDSAKLNMGNARRGRKHTEETKQKIRLAHMGMKPSEETKNKLRMAFLGKPRKAKTLF